MPESVGRLAHPVACFSVNANGRVLNDYFESDKEQEGIVVLDGGNPVGIVMRQDFYQKIGKQYGYSIYMNRPVTLLMKEDFMKADAETEISEISLKAMSRSSESLYDLIVVEDGGKYIGAVSIKHFLVDLSRKREEEIIFLRDVNERERTHRIEIEKMNTAVKSLLDNADQGFLSMGGDFIISNQYSRTCVRVFGREIGGMNLLDLLAPYMNLEQNEVFYSVAVTVLVEKGPLDDGIYLSLLPKELTVGDKTINLEYKVITDSVSRSLMLIMTDITAKKELELKMLEERETLRIIVKAISNQFDIIASVESLGEFLSTGVNGIISKGNDTLAVLSEIYRNIHTFKGDMGQLNMMHAFRKLHDLENGLSGMIEKPETTIDDIRRFISGIDSQSIVEDDVSLIVKILGPGYFTESANVAIPIESIHNLEEWIGNALPYSEQAELLPRIRRLRYKNLKDILSNFEDTVRNILERLGKAVEPLEITGDDVLIDKEKYRDFIRSLSHIFRNAADHGLESPEERLRKGKPVCGRIKCTVKNLNDAAFTISIHDDGRGVDPSIIREKALKDGFMSADQTGALCDADMINLIFKDGFSTRDDVTTVSGRGMGLAAVRSAIRSQGGDISVATEPGSGTDFIINMPFIS